MENNTSEELEKVQLEKMKSIEKIRNEINHLKNHSAELDGSLEVMKKKSEDLLKKAESLETQNTKLRDRIDELKSNAKEAKEKRIKNMCDFETEIANISKTLTEIPSEEKVIDQIKQNYSESKKFEEKGEMIKEEMGEIEEKFKQLRAGPNSSREEDWEKAISTDQKKIVLEMFQKERHDLTKLLESLEKKKAELEEEVKQLQK